MNNETLLTVIVPVHNMELYVENCIESLINQSYKDIYILIIDDASTDKTYQIVESFRENHKNISVIKNNCNQGASCCRNHGLSVVQTKYIAFLDGDDWIDTNCYAKAIQSLEDDNNIDIAMWNINTVYSRSQCIKRYFYEEDNIITNGYALRLFSKSQNSNIYLSPLLGNKVIRVELLKKNNIQFNGYFYEDDIFIFYCLIFSNKIKLVGDANLYYLQRDDSIMHSFSKAVIDELFENFSTFRADLIKNNCWCGNEIYFYSYYEKCIKNLLLFMRNSVKTIQEEREMLHSIYVNFYDMTVIDEYIMYCDLRLFPL